MKGVDHLNPVWPALRLVIERRATLEEVETYYSLSDVVMFNELLDAFEDAT